MPHVEFHRSQIPSDAALLTVCNPIDQEGHIAGASVPFSVVQKGDDLIFMPRMDPIDLDKPFGTCFFALMAGLPSWSIAKVLSRNDFIHQLTFNVPMRRKVNIQKGDTCCGTKEEWKCGNYTIPDPEEKLIEGFNMCCDRCNKSEARAISFMDLCFAILEHKISHSLTRPMHGDKVTPAGGLEYFVKNNMQWHDATDERVVKVAGRALGALYKARNGAVTGFIGNVRSACCGTETSNQRNVAALHRSIAEIENLVGESVITEAKLASSTLGVDYMLIGDNLKYHAAESNIKSDVITLEQRMHFMKLNQRPAPTPLGKCIEVMPCKHPIMVVTPEMLGIVENTSNINNGIGTNSDESSDRTRRGSQGAIATSVPVPIAGISGDRGTLSDIHQQKSATPPVWEPSIFVPPPGSATFVHADKSAISAGGQQGEQTDVANVSATGAAKDQKKPVAADARQRKRSVNLSAPPPAMPFGASGRGEKKISTGASKTN
jgi:hypothetical protein